MSKGAGDKETKPKKRNTKWEREKKNKHFPELRRALWHSEILFPKRNRTGLQFLN
jgi:hypothetical protein